MNFFPMNAGGGKLEETVLWTNPSPTSSFSAQDVTLSDSLANYDYIKIVTKYNTSTEKYGDIIVDYENFKTEGEATTARKGYPIAGAHLYISSNYYPYGRFIMYVSDTVVTFGNACRLYANALDNSSLIPYKVIGIKQTSGGGTVDPPALVDTTLWTNNSPSSTFAGQIVTLSDDITNYDFIKVEYAYQNGSSPVATDISHAIMTIDDFVATGTSPYGFRGSFLTAHRSNGYVYARTFIYNATNKVQITDSIRYSSSGSVATNNDLPMPLRIIGVKKTSDYSNTLVHHSTSVTGTGSYVTCEVVGKVRFLCAFAPYGSLGISRVGTDADCIMMSDTADYKSAIPMFVQNGNQVTFVTGSSGTFTWQVHYWSEE